jgi:hypothetical protein
MQILGAMDSSSFMLETHSAESSSNVTRKDCSRSCVQGQVMRRKAVFCWVVFEAGFDAAGSDVENRRNGVSTFDGATWTHYTMDNSPLPHWQVVAAAVSSNNVTKNTLYCYETNQL